MLNLQSGWIIWLADAYKKENNGMWLNGKTDHISAMEIRGPEKSNLDESDWTKTRSACYDWLGSNIQ